MNILVRLVSMEAVAIHLSLIQFSLFCHPGRCWQLEGEIQALLPMKLGFGGVLTPSVLNYSCWLLRQLGDKNRIHLFSVVVALVSY